MAVSLIFPFYIYVSRFLVSADSLFTWAFFLYAASLYFLLANYNCARSEFGRAKLKQVQHFKKTAVKKKGSL
jgi:hypothetical protein